MADADAVHQYRLNRRRFMAWLGSSNYQAVRKLSANRRQLLPSTREKYANNVQQYLNWLRDSSPRFRNALTTEAGRDAAVVAYRDHLEATVSGSTANVALNAVRAYYQWRWPDAGWPEVAPVPVERCKPRILNVVDQSRMLAAAEARPARGLYARARRARDTALSMVVLYSGLTESEVADLDVDDVDLSATGSCVWGPAPGGGVRKCELPPRAATALAEWETYRQELLGDAELKPYFLGWQGLLADDGRRPLFRRLSRRSVEERLAKLGVAAGLPQRVAPGVLRTTFTRQLLEVEQNPKAVAQALGQVMPDAAQIRALRSIELVAHPGRPRRPRRKRSDADGQGQLALDF